MPVQVAKRGTRFRLVDPDGRIARNRKGTALDGGGRVSREAAARQARVINRNMRK